MSVSNVSVQNNVPVNLNHAANKSLCRQDYKVMALFTLITLSSVGILMNDKCKEWNGDLTVLEFERDLFRQKVKDAEYRETLDCSEMEFASENLDAYREAYLSCLKENKRHPGDCSPINDLKEMAYYDQQRTMDKCDAAKKRLSKAQSAEKLVQQKIIYKQQAKPFMCSRR